MGYTSDTTSVLGCAYLLPLAPVVVVDVVLPPFTTVALRPIIDYNSLRVLGIPPKNNASYRLVVTLSILIN